MKLSLVLLAAGLCACSSTDSADAPPPRPTAAEVETARQRDVVDRVAERMRRKDRLDADDLFRQLERLMPSWQADQRFGRARPMEAILTEDVVAHFDIVLVGFQSGAHERRVVAAWALGFSRVPDNDIGLVSPHPRAVEALVAGIDVANDELMRNILLALWKIGDENTPIEPLVAVMDAHHDGDCRANAALALSVILTQQEALEVVDSVVLAFNDADAKVRMHATNIARLHPNSVYTSRLQSLIVDERVPLVRASMADALGRSGDQDTASVILPLLDSENEIERDYGHRALVRLFGLDRGTSIEAWRDLIAVSGVVDEANADEEG